MCDQQIVNYVEFDILKPVVPQITDVVTQSHRQHGLLIGQKHHGFPKRTKKTEMLARQIANTDDLVQQVRKAVEERQLLEQSLQDFQQSAQAIKDLYEQEKSVRIEYEQKYKTTNANFVELEEAHTRKILEVEHLKEMSSQLRGPLEYNDLVVRYIKLTQEIYEQGNMHRKDKEIVNKLRHYCNERNINVPQFKKCRKKLKNDVGVQSDKSIETSSEIEKITEKIIKSTNDVGTQYISTVATRGTNTHDLICRRDFGHTFPPMPSANSMEKLDLILNEFIEYNVSSYLSPVSPLTVLEEERMPVFETKCIGTEPIDWQKLIETKSVATETTSWPPMVTKKSIGTCTYLAANRSIGTGTCMPEMSSQETCTYLCNLERNIGYIPTVQSAIDAINDINVTQIPTRQHDVHENAAESVLFNKLWGIFGCMVSALINKEKLSTPDNSGISSVLPKEVFSSWYKAACENNDNILATEKNMVHDNSINENLSQDTSTDVALSSMEDEPVKRTSVSYDDLIQEEFSNSDEDSNSTSNTCHKRSSSDRSSDSDSQHESRRITRSSFLNRMPKTSIKPRITPLKAALRSSRGNRADLNQEMPAQVKTQPIKYSARLKSKRIKADQVVAEQLKLDLEIEDNVMLVRQPKKRIAHQRNQMSDNNNEKSQLEESRPNFKRIKINNSVEEIPCKSTNHLQIEENYKTVAIRNNEANVFKENCQTIDIRNNEANVEETCQTIDIRNNEANVEETCKIIDIRNNEASVVDDMTDTNSHFEEKGKEMEIIIKPKLFVKQNLIASKITYNESLFGEEDAESNISEDSQNTEIEENAKGEPNEDNDTENELFIDERGSPLEILELPESPCKIELEPPKPPIVIPLDLDDKYKCQKQQIKRLNNFMTTLVKATMKTKKKKIINFETKKSTYFSILKFNFQQYMSKEDEEISAVECNVKKESATAFIVKLVNEHSDYGLLAKTITNYTRQTLPFGKQQNFSNEHNSVKKIWQLVIDLQAKCAKFCNIFSGEIEHILFNAQRMEKLSLDELINLLKLNLLSENIARNLKHAARLIIAKCLYYYNKMAMPMIYVILCEHPTVLPHREYNNYDKNDALLCVIQHLLMCSKYDMDNKELRHRELLSKLRFEYHYEPFEPNRSEVQTNLITQLRTGTNLTQISYAFALFCKRIDQKLLWNSVLNSALIPLANEWLQQEHCAERMVALLDCISQIVKPLPLQTDVSVFLTLFQRFLSSPNSTIREAAVRAILRLQRFGYVNCYNSLLTFQTCNDTQMQATTLAMLRTFIQRKPLSFWQEINPNEFL